MTGDEFERRRGKRKRTLNLLEYAVLDSRGGVIDRELGRTLDIGEGGLLLDTPAFLEPGSKLRVTLCLGDELLECEGTVVHLSHGSQERFNVGVAFAGFDKRLQELLNRRTRQD